MRRDPVFMQYNHAGIVIVEGIAKYDFLYSLIHWCLILKLIYYHIYNEIFYFNIIKIMTHYLMSIADVMTHM